MPQWVRLSEWLGSARGVNMNGLFEANTCWIVSVLSKRFDLHESALTIEFNCWHLPIARLEKKMCESD